MNERTSMTINTNCLEGIRCPECGFEDRFEIEGTSLFTVVDDGTDDHTGVDWTGESCACGNPDCGYSASLAEFEKLTIFERENAATKLMERFLSDHTLFLDFLKGHVEEWNYMDYVDTFPDERGKPRH